jgi:hypothetical protein
MLVRSSSFRQTGNFIFSHKLIKIVNFVTFRVRVIFCCACI